jgi:hypothetical protein
MAAVFDVAFVAQDLSREELESLDSEAQAREYLANHAAVSVISATDLSCEIEVSLHNSRLGTGTLVLSPARDDAYRWDFAPTAGSESKEWKEAVEFFKDPHRVKAWFESGHVYQDGQLFSMRYQSDHWFDGFDWLYFDTSSVCLSQEKPMKKSANGETNVADLDRIGEPKESSLFSWVVNHWEPAKSGCLFCDDGSDERADFIHIQEARNGSPAQLTLIHVKAAKKPEAKSDSYSVSAYEIVISQALKNLRWLDHEHLLESKRHGKCFWKNGKASTKDAISKVIHNLTHPYQRHVIILQPEVTQTAWSKEDERSVQPKRMLNSLLLSAKLACLQFGATFTVIGPNSASVATPKPADSSGSRKQLRKKRA